MESFPEGGDIFRCDDAGHCAVLHGQTRHKFSVRSEKHNTGSL